MSKRSNLILISLLALAAGCSDVYEIEETMPAVPGNVERMLADFYGKLHPDTRSSKGFNIMDVATSEYTTADFSMSRAGEEDPGSAFNMHTVLLDFGETQGYAVLSDTPGVERIFYYTEAGCLADTAQISPLSNIINGAPEMAASILSRQNDANVATASMVYDESLNIDAIVRFQWDQNWPFNFCATPCSCSKCSTDKRRNHMLAGCVPVAMAQTIATVGDF